MTSTEICISRHQYPALLSILRKTMKDARKYSSLLSSGHFSSDQVVELILGLNLGELLIKYCGLKGAPCSRMIKLCLACLAGRQDEAKANPCDEDLELLIPENELLAIVARRIPHAVVYRAYQNLEERDRENHDSRPFPIMEYGRTAYLLAVHTLGHLGSNYGLSDDLEPILATHCFSQWRTWYTACAQPVHCSSSTRAMIRTAAQVMKNIYPDLRLHSASRGLGEILARLNSPKSLPVSKKENAHGSKVA